MRSSPVYGPLRRMQSRWIPHAASPKILLLEGMSSVADTAQFVAGPVRQANVTLAHASSRDPFIPFDESHVISVPGEDQWSRLSGTKTVPRARLSGICGRRGAQSTVSGTRRKRRRPDRKDSTRFHRSHSWLRAPPPARLLPPQRVSQMRLTKLCTASDAWREKTMP